MPSTSHPQREAWVSLIAGYCLCAGGSALAWMALDFAYSSYSVLTELQYYFKNGPGGFEWKSHWSFIHPLGYVWSLLLYVVYLVFGIRLWLQRGDPRRQSVILLIATLIGTLIHFLSIVESRLSHPSSIAPTALIFEGLQFFPQIAIPCVLIWFVRRDIPDRDRWRPMLTSWMALTGTGLLISELSIWFSSSISGVSLQHPGWRTISWDTLWPLSFILRILNGLIAIAAASRISHKTMGLRAWSWAYAMTNMLFMSAFALMMCVIVNNSSFPGPPGTAKIQFRGFLVVKKQDWFNALGVVVTTASISIPLIIFAHHQSRRLETELFECRHCGYNLRGNTSGRCPECGTSMPSVTAPISPP